MDAHKLVLIFGQGSLSPAVVSPTLRIDVSHFYLALFSRTLLFVHKAPNERRVIGGTCGLSKALGAAHRLQPDTHCARLWYGSPQPLCNFHSLGKGVETVVLHMRSLWFYRDS